MTLFEFIALIKRNVVWVLLISLLTGVGAYLYIAPKKDRVTLLVKCYPNENYVKEILHVAPAVHDLFKKGGKKNKSNYENVDDFIDQYNIRTVRHAKSSADTLNVWFKIIFDDPDADFSAVSNDFIKLANSILIEQSIIADQFSDKSIELLKPLFPDRPYSDVSLSRVTPWKGALIVFILSFIFSALFLAVIRDFKNNRSSSSR
jgi:hypothetical protein